MGEPKTITLKEPITRGSEVITQITVAKPKGKHMRLLPTEPATVGDLWPFISKVTAQPYDVLDELEAEDLMALLGEVSGFLPGGLATGPPSSAT